MARLVILLVLSISAIASAQDNVLLPEGATLAIQLDHGVKAKRAKQGDPVKATLIAPILWRGVIAIPAGAKIAGQVVASETRKASGLSRLVIRFHEARWRGESAPLNAYIIRQLRFRRSFVSAVADNPLCQPPPPRRRPLSDTGTLPSTPTTFTPPAMCESRFDLSDRKTERLVFVSPPLKKMRLVRVPDTFGATQLVSDQKDVSLGRGTMLEIRHSVKPAHITARQLSR